MTLPRARTSSLLLWAFGLAAAGVASGCKREPPPGEALPAPSAAPHVVGSPVVPEELVKEPEPEAQETPEAREEPVEAPHSGPWFAATRASVGVYSDTTFDRKKKIGYLRSGGRVPVDAEVIKKDNCKAGWYRIIDGGYVCGNDGTTDLSSPEVKFATRAPNLEDVLPYTYARNAKNGTPLYKSVPNPEQMRKYEPYLVKKAEPEKDGAKTTEKSAAGDTVRAKHTPLPFSAEAIRAASARTGGESAQQPVEPQLVPPSADAGASAPDVPWWQREDADDRLHEISLEHLEADRDDLLAKRMVRGFYVAVDKQFNWNNRPWYKTTKGLVAPADRFWVTKGSEFKGVEIDGEKVKLPLAWVHGWQKNRPTFTLDPETKQLKNAASLDRFALVPLTGESIEIGGKRYLETTAKTWIREAHVRVTKPGPPPADVGPNERWIDVNLSTQTLVAFEGTRPVYATLVSSGKEHKNKDKDHRTPSGEWRIREKHITTTMDGDGSAAGDLPYSIEDVPYVLYYYRAYALHGAFWHSNYGTQMSHGCVNLSPLDARHIFFFAEPRLPRGWHGVWATETSPGSRVVVHE